MKKIINAKKYDTNTAKVIHNYWNYLSRRDFRSIDETLYKKKTGEYFLYSAGGGLTKYAEMYCDDFSYGEKIIPLSTAQAQKWLESVCDGNDYEKEFGEVEE